MQSIIGILHKNFQEDHINSRRFPGVVGTLASDVNKHVGLKAKDSDPKAKDLSHKATADRN